MTDLERLQDLLSEAGGMVSDAIAQAKDKDDEVRDLREALSDAHGDYEDLEKELEAQTDLLQEVETTAERLHDQARHGGLLRFCTDRTCTAWADLLRDAKRTAAIH